MLFAVAVVLSSSGALGGVAEAFGVHEIGGQVYANVVSVVLSGQDQSGSAGLLSPVYSGAGMLSNGGSQPTDPGSSGLYSIPLDPSLLPRLSGSEMLNRLSVLSPSQVSQFVAANPAEVERLLVSPPQARSVTAWWAAKPATERNAWVSEMPGIVGNLDGVPYSVRDTANRLLLSRSEAALRRAIDSGIGRAKLVEKRHHLDILTQVTRTLKQRPGEPKRQLLTFDPTGEVRAAVVLGNLATADYVSYLVPGMFFTVQGQMFDWTVIAQDLYLQQAAWLKTLSATDPALAGKTAATVAWIGYQTPGMLDIASLDPATSGANFLGHAVRGIQAVRAGSEPYVTLVTHSYGSTAAMMELANGGMTVDALAIIGSPGSAAQTATALAVRNDNVFVGEAAWDPVVNTAFYGSDPASSSFGARKMDVAGATDPITHKTLAAAVGHLGYFGADTTAMRNLALIGIDQGALVSTGSPADASRTLASK